MNNKHKLMPLEMPKLLEGLEYHLEQSLARAELAADLLDRTDPLHGHWETLCLRLVALSARVSLIRAEQARRQ